LFEARDGSREKSAVIVAVSPLMPPVFFPSASSSSLPRGPTSASVAILSALNAARVIRAQA